MVAHNMGVAIPISMTEYFKLISVLKCQCLFSNVGLFHCSSGSTRSPILKSTSQDTK